MDPHLKQRLVGAAVLLSLAVIFLPLVLSGPPPDDGRVERREIPVQPEMDFRSRVKPLGDPQWAKPTLNAPVAYAQDAEPLRSDQVEPKSTAKSPVKHRPQPKVGLSAWSVQVGIFGSKQNAKALSDKMRTKGFDAYVDSVTVKAGKAWQVRVGPELKKSNAQAIVKKIAKQLGLKDAYVTRYP